MKRFNEQGIARLSPDLGNPLFMAPVVFACPGLLLSQPLETTVRISFNDSNFIIAPPFGTFTRNDLGTLLSESSYSR